MLRGLEYFTEIRLHIKLTPTYTGVNTDIYAYANGTKGIYAYIYAHAYGTKATYAYAFAYAFDCVITSEFAYK